MSDILQVRTKTEKAEGILFDGNNAKDIIDGLPVNSWKKVGSVYHIFDDVFDGYQVLEKGQYVVTREVDEQPIVEVMDGPVFWEKYVTKVRMRPGAAFDLRLKTAELAARAYQGVAVIPRKGYLSELAAELETYVKGDDYE